MTLEEFKSMTLEARLDYLFQRNEPAPIPCPQPPVCCVCGTTDNLFYDGPWHGHRCKSPDCAVF